MSYKEIIVGCGVKTTILQKFGISLLTLQKEIFGLSCDRIYRKGPSIEVTPLKELKTLFSLNGQGFMCLYDAVKRHLEDDVVKDVIKAIIAQNKKYVGVVEFMKKSNLSFESLDRYKIVEINKELGYTRDRRSAAEDDLYLLLVDYFGEDKVSREHTFMDCRGDKGWPLRFDFFLPDYDVLIELDGSSHLEGNHLHKDYTDSNREAKEDYALLHGYRLLVYQYKDIKDIPKVFYQIILDILKPVELLESPPLGQSATKPVSNPEGSETIEKHGNVN